MASHFGLPQPPIWPNWEAELRGCERPNWEAMGSHVGDRARQCEAVRGRIGRPWEAEVGGRSARPKWEAKVGGRSARPKWEAKVGGRGRSWEAEVGGRGRLCSSD